MAGEACAAGQGAVHATLCFFGVAQGIQNYKDVAGLIALVIVLLGFLYNLYRTINAFLLVRRMNPGESRGSILSTLFTILEIVVRHPLAFFHPTWNLFVRMRMRVEHEIFEERPKWEWPVPQSKRQGFVGYFVALGRFVAERARWHWKMAWISHNQMIRIKTAGDLNDRFDAIQRYFESVRSLPFAGHVEASFLCPVEVAQGFVAPLHLLTGVLAQYNDKWDPLIERFQTFTRTWDDVTLIDGKDSSGRMTAQDFRQIQSFIYHCWLQWGPSIPVCKPSCGHWRGNYVSIQYGFGDENNSVEIVGNREVLTKAVRAMKDSYFPRLGGMAFPASVVGVLQYSTLAQRDGSDIPPLLQASWGGEQDARPILFFSEPQVGDALTGRRSAGDAIVGMIKPEIREPSRVRGASRYYSAYLWVMFVVLREYGPDDWRPIDGPPGKESAAPWLTTIPFFEHGNIADAESCEFAKQTLADKVVSGILQFAAEWRDGTYPLRFAYASAIDDANCGEGLEFEDMAGGTTIRKRIEDALDAAPRGSTLRKLVNRDVFQFDYFNKEPNQHPHSACALPYDVAAYYATGPDPQSESASRKEDGVFPSNDEEAERLASAPRSEEGESSEMAAPD